MTKSGYGVLSNQGRYTKFAYHDVVITFLHGKDLIKYLAVKEWDKGYLVVECLGKVKGEYHEAFQYDGCVHTFKALYGRSLRESKRNQKAG